MSVDEKVHLLDYLADSGIPADRMMPGTGCCSFIDSVRLTAKAVEMGCAGVLMLPPFYYKGVSDEGLFRNFSEIIQRVGDSRLRIYLYNIPPVSQVAISVALIERLLTAYPDTIAGAKDSSGDWEVTRSYIDNFAQHGFDVFPGAETFLLQGLRQGGVGCISATANVHPGPIARLYSTWSSNDADAQQIRLNEIRKIFASYPMIPALKSAIAEYSGDASWGTVRPPLIELSDAQRSALNAELASAKFEMPGLRKKTA